MVKSSPTTSPSELQIALDNRAFEIQLFWQRSNYFMVLMTALGIGVFAIQDQRYAFIVSIFATIASFFWYKTNLGSKFWQESWEVEVTNLAKDFKIRSFERSTGDVIKQVETSLKSVKLDGERKFFRRWLDRQILKKPSVSYYMILLSLTSTLMWGLVTAIIAYDIYSEDFAANKPVAEANARPDRVLTGTMAPKVVTPNSDSNTALPPSAMQQQTAPAECSDSPQPSSGQPACGAPASSD